MRIRSAWVLLPDTKPNAGRRGQYGHWLMSNPPSCSTFRISSRTTAGSRHTKSSKKRSKFEAFDISIDGLEVCRVSAVLRGRYLPVLKNSSSTSFSLVATISCLIGNPIMRAICPASTLPKLPDGTANETFSALDWVTAK